MSTEVIKVDYSNPAHAAALVSLLDSYARDPMGGGHALDEEVKRKLPAALADRAHAFSVLAYADGLPVGLINCFEGFSTFACMPLINIHDVAVLPEYRGKGIAQAMMACVEEIARERGCCKLTLEVLSDNHGAKQLYSKLGYGGYRLGEIDGSAQFWQKKLA